ncbi:MAG: alpha/beta hydrolase, partial [Chloroflexota bacterium]
MGKVLLSALIIAVSCYCVLVAVAYFTQGRMLYYPTRELEATPADIGLGFEEVTVRTRDGVALSTWYVPSRTERGIVVFCHGNAGNISHRLDSIRIFHDLGMSVLIFDYRGYGKSEGSPTEQGTYLDAEAVWEYLVNLKGILPGKIVIFGRSLGGAVAAHLAATREAAALIVESGFTSVPDLGARHFPYLPVRLISRFGYRTIEKVQRTDIPKLFIHSPQDEIVPYSQGLELFARAAEPKEFLEITGGHNDGFLVSGERY